MTELDWKQITALIIAVGAIVKVLFDMLKSVLGYSKTSKDRRSEDFKLLLEEYTKIIVEQRTALEESKEINVKLLADLRSMEKELNMKELEISSLKSGYTLYTASNLNLPFPLWHKNLKLEFTYVNTAYEKEVLNKMGLTINDISFKTNEEIFGKVVGEQFSANDHIVLENKRSLMVEEFWQDGNGGTVHGWVVKFPIMTNNLLVGVGGLFIPKYIKKGNDGK